LRRRYGSFGRDYVAQFDWMRVAEQFLTVTRG